MEQIIKGQMLEQQASVPASEESAGKMITACDATPRQQQNGNEQQQAESQAPQRNEAASPSTAAGGSQLATRPTSQAVATNNQVGDPVEAEPYRWHECTVGINITLIPDPTNKEHYQTAMVGIRTHNDAPIIRRVAAVELLPLPAIVMELVREMREQLPARAEAREERMARAKQTAQTAKQSAAKTQPAKAKVKPGRHVGASALAATSAVAQESFDDDLFSTRAVSETTCGTAEEGVEGTEQFASEPQERAASAEASDGAVKESPPPTQSHARHKAPKYDKHGRSLDSKSPSTPKNQMSLI